VWVRHALEGKGPIGDDARVPMSLITSLMVFAWGQDRAELADLLDKGIVQEPRPGVLEYSMPLIGWFRRRMPDDWAAAWRKPTTTARPPARP